MEHKNDGVLFNFDFPNKLSLGMYFKPFQSSNLTTFYYCFYFSTKLYSLLKLILYRQTIKLKMNLV